MGHPTGCQRRVRSRHGGRAGGLPATAQSRISIGLPSQTSKQLIAETPMPIPTKPGHPARLDYEYERNGTANLFMMFAPLQGWRHVEVTDRHTAVDYAHALKDLSDARFPQANKIVLVHDNLNTHKPPHSTKLFLPPRHVGSSRGSSGTTPPNTAVGWTWLESELSSVVGSVSRSAYPQQADPGRGGRRLGAQPKQKTCQSRLALHHHHARVKTEEVVSRNMSDLPRGTRRPSSPGYG